MTPDSRNRWFGLFVIAVVFWAMLMLFAVYSSSPAPSLLAGSVGEAEEVALMDASVKDTSRYAPTFDADYVSTSAMVGTCPIVVWRCDNSGNYSTLTQSATTVWTTTVVHGAH